MNDREMLERLEHPAMFDGRCPECYMKGPHTRTCELGKHLHPEAVVGSAAWAEAQGMAGKKVRRRCWPNKSCRWFWTDGRWFTVSDDAPADMIHGGLPPAGGWELYVPPEPETVRWALCRDLGEAYRGDGGSCRILKLQQGSVIAGYRLKTFVGEFYGAEIEMGGCLTGWVDDNDVFTVTPRPNAVQVWATHAVMERVAQ